MRGSLLVRGTHKDGQPFEARIVEGEPTNLRDADNSIVVEVIHGAKRYRRRWHSAIWAQARLQQRCQVLEDWSGPNRLEYI